MSETVKRKEFDINGIAAYRYDTPISNLASRRASILGPGLLRGMTQNDTADQIARAIVANTNRPLFALDPSGSFNSKHRMQNGTRVGYSFKQYVADVEEVGVYCREKEGITTFDMFGYSMAGPVMAVAAKAIAEEAEIETMAFMQSPHTPTAHQHIAEYERFKRTLLRRHHTFGETYFSEEVLDPYLRMGSMTVLLSELVAKGVTPRMVYVTSDADGVVSHPVLPAKIPNLTMKQVPKVPHDTTDPAAISRLVGAIIK